MLDNERFGKRLVKAGVITQDQLEEALRHQELQEGRLGEILVRLGYVSESTILQFLAAEFRTRYVSTERLARARIPQQVLDLLPVHLAERYNLIPVLYDAETSTLSIVTSEPQNEENLREVHMLTSVRELRVYVALQPAVQAAIRKHYRGEINAFKDLLYQNVSPLPDFTNANPYGQADHSTGPTDGYTDGYDPNVYGGMDPHNQGYGNPYGQQGNPYDPSYGHTYDPNTAYQYGNTYDPNQYDYQHGDQGYGNPYGNDIASYGDAGNPYQDDYDNEVTRLHVGPYTIGNYDQDTVYPDAQGDYANNVEAGTAGVAAELPPLAQVDVLALTRMMVSQLERLHPRYKDHLERQRPLLQAILRRLEFSLKESQPIWLAFYLHHSDLPDPHPTLMTLAKDEKARDTYKALHKSFMQRMDLLRLPEESTEVLQYLYERADGHGFPDGLLREEIPLGARLLAILDAFEQLVHEFPTKSNSDRLQMLRDEQGTLFDSRLLNIFEGELERVEQFQQGLIPRVLLLEPQLEAVQELERVLWERNFWVYVATHPSEAEEICRREPIDLMVLEVAMKEENDGFVFAEHIKESFENPPEFIFLTKRDSQEELERGMALARDYLIKPLSANVIAIKLHQQVQQITKERASKKRAANAKPNQLSGSLEQLGLADLLQFLSQGRRSGRLSIECSEGTGHIFLDTGMVVNAQLHSDKGEAALYKMMAWETGIFSLDPSVTSEERLIHKSTDGLLLDLLRILDESRRDGVDDPFASQGGSGGDDFFDLTFDDDDDDEQEDEKAPDPPDKPTPSQSRELNAAKGRGGKKKGTPVLFGDLAEDDLDDVFSSSFKEASRDNLSAKK